MITKVVNRSEMQELDGNYVSGYTYFGLSTDVKPSLDESGNASVFVEIDTGNVLFYDGSSQAWLAFPV